MSGYTEAEAQRAKRSEAEFRYYVVLLLGDIIVELERIGDALSGERDD